MLASKTLPRASILQGLTSYFQSKWKGLMRMILPSLTSTCTGFASMPTPRKDRPLTTVFSFSPISRLPIYAPTRVN